MKRPPLCSHSRRTGASGSSSTPLTDPTAAVRNTAAATPAQSAADDAPGPWQRLAHRHERRLWLLVLVLGALAFWWRTEPPVAAPLSFVQIDHLVRKSIEEKPLTPPARLAYERMIPSVVRVVGLAEPEPAAKEAQSRNGKPGGKPGTKPEPADEPANPAEPVEQGVGTGVVIIDNGTILTNLHVVMGARAIRVTFADGLESDAQIVNVMYEHDLAVLRTSTVPDDLVAATMRSTGGLAPGDSVLAIGFPFGIGPSASVGVVSGLKREFRSPEGKRVLTNLIQFDAAANPGNSGGPLVTMDGEVVGIVTAILNPTEQRVFVGIGFAVPIENAAAGAGMHPF
ncbi:MAG: trypsin-like peptidase domain-containing protein [Azoarcus sp.]|nr:trypsin-like peptidase domain-containing protein [Azoarcus sp.]